MARTATFIAFLGTALFGIGVAAGVVYSPNLRDAKHRLTTSVDVRAPTSTPPLATGGVRAVYHVNGEGGPRNAMYANVLHNISNHLDAVDDGATIVVVMNGLGVDLLREARGDRSLAAEIDRLRLRDVRFLVCRRTLLERHIAASDLYRLDNDDIVTSGVAEIARMQQAGYAYLKP